MYIYIHTHTHTHIRARVCVFGGVGGCVRHIILYEAVWFTYLFVSLNQSSDVVFYYMKNYDETHKVREIVTMLTRYKQDKGLNTH